MVRKKFIFFNVQDVFNEHCGLWYISMETLANPSGLLKETHEQQNKQVLSFTGIKCFDEVYLNLKISVT